MQSLLDSVGRSFDVCVIDVEGLDLSVLKWLHVEKALPSVLFYEHKCLSPQEVRASFGLLRECGYNLPVDNSEYAAYRQRHGRQ